MFNEIGKRIKAVAKIVCALGVCVMCFIGIIMIVVGGNMRYGGGEGLETSGIIILLAGWIVPWIGSLFLYGFGELIDKTCEIAQSVKPKEQQENINEALEKLRIQRLISEAEYLEKMKRR